MVLGIFFGGMFLGFFLGFVVMALWPSGATLQSEEAPANRELSCSRLLASRKCSPSLEARPQVFGAWFTPGPLKGRGARLGTRALQ